MTTQMAWYSVSNNCILYQLFSVYSSYFLSNNSLLQIFKIVCSRFTASFISMSTSRTRYLAQSMHLSMILQSIVFIDLMFIIFFQNGNPSEFPSSINLLLQALEELRKNEQHIVHEVPMYENRPAGVNGNTGKVECYLNHLLSFFCLLINKLIKKYLLTN